MGFLRNYDGSPSKAFYIVGTGVALLGILQVLAEIRYGQEDEIQPQKRTQKKAKTQLEQQTGRTYTDQEYQQLLSMVLADLESSCGGGRYG